MSRRYSRAHKLLVLRLLQAFEGNITLTSDFTGIPERTLREWRRQAKLAGRLPASAIRIRFVHRRQP